MALWCTLRALPVTSESILIVMFRFFCYVHIVVVYFDNDESQFFRLQVNGYALIAIINTNMTTLRSGFALTTGSKGYSYRWLLRL